MPRYISLPGLNSSNLTTVPISNGGTSAITPTDALTNLNGVPASAINKPNGVLGLDAYGDISITTFNTVTISGPEIVGKGSVSPYLVTNYDSFTTYETRADKGTVSLVSDTGAITYTAPNVVSPDAGFYINGRYIPVDVG